MRRIGTFHSLTFVDVRLGIEQSNRQKGISLGTVDMRGRNATRKHAGRTPGISAFPSLLWLEPLTFTPPLVASVFTMQGRLAEGGGGKGGQGWDGLPALLMSADA